ALGHRRDRRSAVAGRSELVGISTGRSRQLLSRNVRFDLGFEDARVHEQDVDALLAHAVAKGRILVPLGVQRSDENDGGHHIPPAARAVGSQAALESLFFESVRVFSLPPVAATVTIAPSRVNAIVPPFGDQAGSISSPGDESISRRPLPSIPIV